MGEFLSKKLGAVQALMLGIPPKEWLIAGVVGVVVWAGLWILRDLIASRLGVHFAHPTQLVVLDKDRPALES
jgi:hypothetical protein